MEYTTPKGDIMPEYGRNVQQMIEHALTIEDRKERTRCVNTIVDIREICFHSRDGRFGTNFGSCGDYVEFQTDIDYPYEIVRRFALMTEHIPCKIQNQIPTLRRNLEEMIARVPIIRMETFKTNFVTNNNQMKKCF